MEFKIRLNQLLLTLATLLLSVETVAANQRLMPATDAGSSIDKAIEQQMREAKIVGVGAAIIINKKVVWTKGYGYADKERAVPFTPETIMNAGSIAKPVVGVAMMQAVQKGKLALDEDINKYLQFRVVNPHHPSEKITLRHLATHTSGITDRWDIYSRTYHFGSMPPQSLEQFLRAYLTPEGNDYSRDNFSPTKPGALRGYSNIGAALAGYVVERAFGAPLNDYTRKHIFTPLGMTRTGWQLSEVDLASHTKLYVSHMGHSIPIPLYSSTTYPDGGVRTSVADLSKFFIALLNGGEYQGVRILEAGSAAEMLRFQFTDANRPKNFPESEGNSGLFWRTKFKGTRVGHGGNDPGIQTEMLSDLSKEVGVILFVNTSLEGSQQRASFAIFDSVWKHALTLREKK